MATRTQGGLTDLNVGGLTGINPQTLPTFTANDNASDFQLNYDEPSSTTDDNASGNERTAQSEIEPSEWMKKSSLMNPKVTEKYFICCFFDPLGFCVPGSLIFGFCPYHLSFLFNVFFCEMNTVNRQDESTMNKTSEIRRLIKFPLKFSTNLLNVMPIPELCTSYEDLIANLSLDLFAYNLKLRKDSTTTDVELATHKKYLSRVFALYTQNKNYQHETDDHKIILTTNNWVSYLTEELDKMKFDARLLVMINTPNGVDIKYLDVKKLSVFTKAIVLLHETPFVKCDELNGQWLSSPSAYTVYNGKCIVIDQTKASHGTAYNRDTIAFGDPATLSYFRLDRGEDVIIVHDNYQPITEVCYKTHIDKAELIGLGNSKHGLLSIEALKA